MAACAKTLNNLGALFRLTDHRNRSLQQYMTALDIIRRNGVIESLSPGEASKGLTFLYTLGMML